MSESIPPRMFEYHDAKSDKFWKIELNGNAHTVTYGRVGTNGQTSTKEFADHAKAKKDYEKLIGQKTKKGYAEVADESESRSGQLKASQEEQKLHQPFIDAIQEDPDDLAAYHVYADWLEENGNPRGEFIRVQLQLEDSSTKAADRKKLEKREKELLKAHEREWLGVLAEDLMDSKMPEQMSYYGKTFYEYEFGRGFLDSLKVNYLLPNFARTLKNSPQVLMLRKLVFPHLPNGDELMEEFEEFEDKEWEYEDVPGLQALSGAEFSNLRHLEMDEQESWNCHLSAPGVDKLLKKTPRLETLSLAAHNVESSKVFKCKLPELRSLRLYHNTDYDIVALARNDSLTNLESIDFFPHALDYDDEPYINLKKVQAICKAKQFSNLTFLRLSNGDFGNAGVKAIVAASFASSLETLDLSYGCIQDEGADLILEAKLNNLKTLDLSGNFVSSAAIKRLTATGLNVISKEMYSGVPDEEHEYLCNGDIE